MKNIQSKLIDYIKDNTGTSFVEIEKYLMKMILIIKVKEHIPVQRIAISYFGMDGMSGHLMQ